MNLLYDSLVVLGFALILKYGTILDMIKNPIKKIPFFKALLECCLCMGFWIGLGVGLFGSEYGPSFAFYSAAFCWFGDYLIQIIQKHLYDK